MVVLKVSSSLSGAAHAPNFRRGLRALPSVDRTAPPPPRAVEESYEGGRDARGRRGTWSWTSTRTCAILGVIVRAPARCAHCELPKTPHPRDFDF